MKRILVVLSIIVTMFAETIYSESTVGSTIYFYRDDSFYVTIPDYIQVGESCGITAEDINISSGKSVHVSLLNNDDYITIYNTSDSDSSVDVYFVNEFGDTVGNGNPSIVSFSSNENGVTKYFNTFVSNTELAQAGEYSGSVTFRIYCD